MRKYLVECFHEEKGCKNIKLTEKEISETEIFSGLPDEEKVKEDVFHVLMRDDLKQYFIFKDEKFFITDLTLRDMNETKRNFLFKETFSNLGSDSAQEEESA